MFWYDAETFEAFICQPGKPNAQWLYATTQATLDVIFPIVYGTLLGILIGRFYDRRMATGLLLLPLLAFVFDLSENAVTIYLAMNFDCDLESLSIPWLAIILTPTKWFFVVASMLSIIIGLIGGPKSSRR